jgi:glucose-1-phosphate adenylyltransferase
MDALLVVLAGGMSSRMKRAAERAPEAEAHHVQDAREKAKAMIRVGPGGRPFLDFCLKNIAGAGYAEVVIVTGERDASIRGYYETEGHAGDFPSLAISYVVQRIPPGRNKPLGTADALLGVLQARPQWRGRKFTVCNSDNIYSVGALRDLLGDTHPNALIDYDRGALGFPPERTTQFAVITTGEGGFVSDIIEKPSAADIASAAEAGGRVGVSMNIFRLSYDVILPYLESVPLHPSRNEKELPVAVRMLASERPRSVFAIRRSEAVPDLTRLADIPDVQKFISTTRTDTR